MTDALAENRADRFGAACRRVRRDELSAERSAAACHCLSAALTHSVCALVSVLLDGAHVGETRRATARPRHLQPVLDVESDAQARLQAVVRDRLSDLAMEHDVGGSLRDRVIDYCQRARCLCDRAASV